MKIITILMIGLFITGCAVGWGKPSQVRHIKLPNNEYQIVVDGDPWLITMGGLTEKFHERARSICPDYQVVSFQQSPGHGGTYSFSLSNVSGVIRCK
jgi:hypothetical protein